ncbi:MAG TPA: GntR family transcriptional regulator [Polyangiaceae bacterium]|nr:GntR family transcriptional regulator [Polyangiaceae bacterium]
MKDEDFDSEELPQRPNIADSVFEELRGQILSGKLKAGQRLAGERELAISFGTNRNTLREAVRKLEQAGLVSVRHGQGVTVCDFRRTGTLELFTPYLQSGPDMREIVEMLSDALTPRVMLIEYATRLAARRAVAADLEQLNELCELLITAFNAKEARVVANGFHRWLDALVDAGHSTAMRWITNPFLRALKHLLNRLPMLWILEPSFPDHLREVIRAIEAGDEEAAASTTRAYYQKVDAQLLQLLERVVATTSPRQAS